MVPTIMPEASEIQLFLIKLKNTMRLKIYMDMEWEETT